MAAKENDKAMGFQHSKYYSSHLDQTNFQQNYLQENNCNGLANFSVPYHSYGTCHIEDDQELDLKISTNNIPTQWLVNYLLLPSYFSSF